MITVVTATAFAQATPDVPAQFRKYFFHYADRRAIFEKALNTIGLTSLAVPRSFALVAGVANYPNFPPVARDLRPAAVDIENLKRYLRDQEFFDEIIVLQDGDVTVDNLEYFLGHYLPEQMARSPHSRFLLAYSGHGYAVGSGRTARGFLLKNSASGPTDTVNAIPLTLLRSSLGPTIDSAEKVLVLINACNSGSFVARVPFGADKQDLGAKGAHAIVASRTTQKSFHDAAVGPGSIFFEKVFAALNGVADRSPADGVVTYHELADYLHGEIPLATNGAQAPMEGDLSRDASEGDFYFFNRSRQVRVGNVPAWNPRSATAFGADADRLEEQGREADESGRYEQALQLFKQAADAGNAAAMNLVGRYYFYGRGVAQDLSAARQWYEKAAAAGSPAAMNNLGYVYHGGHGVKKDHTLAREWYEKSIGAGDASAMNNLGYLYDKGQGVKQDYVLARQWYEKAAEGGVAAAMANLGVLYEKGLGVKQDYAEARRRYEKGAAAGSKDAMAWLGTLYNDGHGVQQDYAEARRWYEKAIDAGSEAAMTDLGTLYYYGRGVQQDYAQARQWYDKAAAAGEPTAMYSLGVLFEKGEGVRRDYGQARNWFEKSAAGGEARAMFSLGVMYDYAWGVKRDYAQARQWYEKAAAAGEPDAMHDLGYLYESGHGVKRDKAKAAEWYEKAAAAGNTAAAKRLERMHK